MNPDIVGVDFFKIFTFNTPILLRKNIFRFKIFHPSDTSEITRMVSDGVKPFPAGM